MRFRRGMEWSSLVTELDGTAVTGLTKLAGQRTVAFGLNKPAVATGVVPSDDPRVNTLTVETGLDAPHVSFNDRLLYLFRNEGGTPPWVCRFAGILEQLEDAASDDQPYSTLTAYDPWQYLFARPIKNGTSLVGPNGMSFDDSQASYIVQFLMDNTIGVDGPVHVDVDSGVYEATRPIDINFPQSTSVGAALQMLAATHTCDIVFDPVYDPLGDPPTRDPRPGICSVLNVYARAGTYRDDAVFAWDIGRSVTGISSLFDGDQMANDIQFFAGQGGPSVVPAVDASSEARYGVWGTQQFFPGQAPTDPAQLAAAEFSINLLAQFQLGLRKNGRRTVSLTPASLLAPVPLLDYGLGDRVPVYATRRLRQPIPWP